MQVYEIEPTTDRRWEEFLSGHGKASVFHTAKWLRALQQTYGYAPTAFTTSPPEVPLTNGIAFCRVKGLFGKERLVSLPFSDHCLPLVGNRSELIYLLRYLRERLAVERWSEVQVRAGEAATADPAYGQDDTGLVLHTLDLRPQLAELFDGFHPSCVQRKIRRAQRDGVVSEEGTSPRLLDDFYKLLLLTRRRHGLPPQPIAWFRNLIDSFGDQLKIRVAYFQGSAIASILTLRYEQTLMYKYGCSDRSAGSVGGMQLLLWNAICEGSRDGLTSFDMGRTEISNTGLVAFKDRWGARKSLLHYASYPPQRSTMSAARAASFGRHVCAWAPDVVLTAAGRLLYRHMA